VPRVLVVDDRDYSRYATVHTLREGGFDVLEAASGQEGLDLAHKHPDLIVLDIGLPDLDGVEVYRRLQESPDTTSIPVVFLTATYRDPASRRDALLTGAAAFLSEPLEPGQLVRTVEQALARRRT
jgi:CheY-like chemotaxis protein